MHYIKSIEKVLFLDIDGVLNKAENGKDLYCDTYADYCVCLHKPAVEALKAFVDAEPKLRIVWLSDWAKHRDVEEQNCSMSPIAFLEMLPWLKERVVGDVFVGKHADAVGDAKIKAIDDFTVDNLVESYAVLDDDTYAVEDSLEHVHKHIVKVDPCKGFCKDDICRVQKALGILMDGKAMHSMLLSLEHTDSFVVNGKYRCQFDFTKYGCKKAPLFKDYVADNNCPRMAADAEVIVDDLSCKDSLYDKKPFIGCVSLSIDKDLDSSWSATLSIREGSSTQWQSIVPIVSLSRVQKMVD